MTTKMTILFRKCSRSPSTSMKTHMRVKPFASWAKCGRAPGPRGFSVAPTCKACRKVSEKEEKEKR